MKIPLISSALIWCTWWGARTHISRMNLINVKDVTGYETICHLHAARLHIRRCHFPNCSQYSRITVINNRQNQRKLFALVPVSLVIHVQRTLTVLFDKFCLANLVDERPFCGSGGNCSTPGYRNRSMTNEWRHFQHGRPLAKHAPFKADHDTYTHHTKGSSIIHHYFSRTNFSPTDNTSWPFLFSTITIEENLLMNE